MRPDGRLGVGIVGAHPSRGWALATHLPALRASAEFAINAVCAKEAAVAAEAARVFGAPRHFANVRDLCADPSVDVVVICLRVPMHLDAVTAAVEAGKHVYCEWPLGRDLAESVRMRDLADQARVHTAIGLQGRTSPVIEKAKAMIWSGDLGRPLSARLYSTSRSWGAVTTENYAYLSDRDNGATLLTITGGHSFDALGYLVGEFDSVSALLATQRDEVTVSGSNRVLKPTSPDHILVCGRHTSGCVTSAHIAGGASSHGHFLLEIVGTHGDLTISGDVPGDFQTVSLSLSGHIRGEALEPWSDRDERAPLSSGVANVARVYDQLAADIRNNTRNVADFADAVAIASLLEAIERSSQSSSCSRLATAQG